MIALTPDSWNWTMMLGVAAFFAAGLAFGRLYFHALQRCADLLAGGGSLRKAAGLTIARLVLIGAVLTVASLQGALPLLATALGVFLARKWAMRGLPGQTS